jgi:hypothetical protein
MDGLDAKVTRPCNSAARIVVLPITLMDDTLPEPLDDLSGSPSGVT